MLNSIFVSFYYASCLDLLSLTIVKEVSSSNTPICIRLNSIFGFMKVMIHCQLLSV
jgi:hypothetical protein